MLSSLTDLRNFRIEAIDAEMGASRDLLFDGYSWTISDLVADKRE